MKKIILLISIFLSAILLTQAQESIKAFDTPPVGNEVKIFAEGIVNTKNYELNSVFSPDGTEFVFTRTVNDKETIYISYYKNDKWTTPEPISFTDEYNDVDPNYSPDGNTILYCSFKPIDGKIPEAIQLFAVDRKGDSWGKPYHIKIPGFDTKNRILYPSLTKNNKLYFHVTDTLDKIHKNIYVADYKDGICSNVKKLGAHISSEYAEGDVFVDHQEKYLIFPSRRPGGYGSGDLYISVNKNGEWQEPINMGATINKEPYDFCPVISPDYKYFFFTRQGVIYWTDFQELLKQIQK